MENCGSYDIAMLLDYSYDSDNLWYVHSKFRPLVVCTHFSCTQKLVQEAVQTSRHCVQERREYQRLQE